MHMVVVIAIMVAILMGLWSARRAYKADLLDACAARHALRRRAVQPLQANGQEGP
jgi:hypothetical protein